MWLTSSSIGRKFVMALTGICLVLFVTFHVLMNSVALLWPAAYNSICEFLGANWYALVASIGLAVLFIIHIIYAVWLTVQNRAARGSDRYAVTSRPPQVEWSSKNMLVLGFVVVAFLILHLIQFWAKMQLTEILSEGNPAAFTEIDGAAAAPAFGTLFLQEAFSCIWTPIIYIVGFIALWFHMTHGFWSMLHSVGWDNNHWLPRLKCIANWWTSIVVLLFVAQAVLFTVQANNKFFLNDPALQDQYAEYWGEQAEETLTEFNTTFANAVKDAKDQATFATAQQNFINQYGQQFIDRINVIDKARETMCPDAVSEPLNQAKGLKEQLEMYMQQNSNN